MNERSEGYVIRWPRSRGYDYAGLETPSVADLQRAPVMSLSVASRYLRAGGFENAEIVRVRRVATEDQWRLATPEEAEEYGYSYGCASDNLVFRFVPRDNGEESPARYLRKRVPSEPRWEVVEE